MVKLEGTSSNDRTSGSTISTMTKVEWKSEARRDAEKVDERSDPMSGSDEGIVQHF